MCSTLLTTFRATATLDFMPGTTSSTACGDGDCRGRGGQDPDSKVRSVFAAGHARSHAKQTIAFHPHCHTEKTLWNLESEVWSLGCGSL